MAEANGLELKRREQIPTRRASRAVEGQHAPLDAQLNDTVAICRWMACGLMKAADVGGGWRRG